MVVIANHHGVRSRGPTIGLLTGIVAPRIASGDLIVPPKLQSPAFVAGHDLRAAYGNVVLGLLTVFKTAQHDSCVMCSLFLLCLTWY
jgi:hypothetical protein